MLRIGRKNCPHLIKIENHPSQHPKSLYEIRCITNDYDIDVALIIDDCLSIEDVEAELSDFLFDILLERNELISVFAIPERIFET